MVGTAASPWFQLFAFIICAALTAFAVMTFFRAEKTATPAAWWSAVGSLIFLGVGVFAFYFGETAGTADARPVQTEGMTELNNRAPPAPTTMEIEKDSQDKYNQAFGETIKPVEDHQNEADEVIDRALERAAKRDNQ